MYVGVLGEVVGVSTGAAARRPTGQIAKMGADCDNCTSHTMFPSGGELLSWVSRRHFDFHLEPSNSQPIFETNPKFIHPSHTRIRVLPQSHNTDSTLATYKWLHINHRLKEITDSPEARPG